MKKIFLLLAAFLLISTSVNAAEEILKTDSGRGYRGILLQNSSSGSATLLLPTGDMSDISLYLPQSAGYIIPSSASNSFSISATTMPSGISKLISGTVTVSPLTNDTVFAGYGNLNFTGSATAGGGHGAGIIGLFTDTSANTFVGYGVEGRTNATGAASIYVGTLGLGTWTGAGTYSGILAGVQARVELTTDGSTPNTAGGTTAAFYAPAVVGGATKFSFYGSDPMYVNSTITATGEANFGGVSGDGSGKVVCVNASGNLGTCSSVVGAGGTCTCS